MNDRRAKVAATATVLGLGALGGIALQSNQGLPATTAKVAGAQSEALVTGASSTGAVSRPVAVRKGVASRPAIVTRASGGLSASGSAPVDD
jgi:hypothetical protein